MAEDAAHRLLLLSFSSPTISRPHSYRNVQQRALRDVGRTSAEGLIIGALYVTRQIIPAHPI